MEEKHLCDPQKTATKHTSTIDMCKWQQLIFWGGRLNSYAHVQQQNCLLLALVICHFSMSFFLNTGNFAYIARQESFFHYNGAQFEPYELNVQFYSAKLVGIIFIYLFWRSIIICSSRNKLSVFYRSYLLLSVPAFFVAVITYPESYGLEIDNYVTLSYSLRFIPFYWHSAFTSVFYAGCFSFLPHPIAIPVIQSNLLVALIAYIYSQMKDVFGRWEAYGVFVFFLIPETVFVALNPYRNCFYTMLTLLSVSLVVFHHLKRTHTTLLFTFKTSFLFALIGVWRSEGIVLSLAFAYFVFFVANFDRRSKKIICISWYIVFFLALSYIQNVGSTAHHGKDYVFISAISQLQNIFNSSHIDINYSLAGKDIEAINKIVPLELLKEYGVTGYYAYNHSEGRGLTASNASDETQKNFMSAYLRIISRNKSIFLKTQLNMFLRLFSVKKQFYIEPFSGTHNNVDTDRLFDISLFKTGKNELVNTLYTDSWKSSAGRQRVLSFVPFKYTFGRHILLVYVLSIGLLALFITKHTLRKKYHFLIFLCFVSYIQAVLVILSMPGGRTAYFYPANYVIFFLCLVMLCLIYNNGVRMWLLGKRLELTKT